MRRAAPVFLRWMGNSATSDTSAMCDDTGCVAPANWRKEGTKFPIMGDESIMSNKGEHGTSHTGLMEKLLYNVDRGVADRICNHNRHYAEHSGYFRKTTFTKDVDPNGVTEYYDSNSGKLLFRAPVGRTFQEFLSESTSHGWPSFRDQEVNWDFVRVLPDGEAVSVDGTHLGHNIPDRHGNRYCINLVSVAGTKGEQDPSSKV